MARVCLESYWWEQREGAIASRGFRPCLTAAAAALAANVAAHTQDCGSESSHSRFRKLTGSAVEICGTASLLTLWIWDLANFAKCRSEPTPRGQFTAAPNSLLEPKLAEEGHV